MRCRILLYLFITCFLASTANAQDITGSIVGRVTDASGAAIVGASVLVHNEGTGADTKQTVGSSGDYAVPNLFAGQYSIVIQKEGFASATVHNLSLRASQILRQNVALKAGAVFDTEEVKASDGLIHTDNQMLGSSLGAKQLEELPLATRSIDNLIQLAPGVTTSGSNPRISGSNYWGGNNFTLNGISVNDAGNGGGAYTSGVSNLAMANMPSPDSLQEFKVDSGNLNAEYRDVASITMVTKQGTNAFHVMAYEYFQNAALNANQFMLKAKGISRPVGNVNQFGIGLGGPLLKNRVFYYGAYRGVRQATSAVASLTMPSKAMQGGDFSALCTTFVAGVCTVGTQLYNPFTGNPFANNQITPSLITSQAKTLLGYLPTLTNASATGLPNATADYVASKITTVGINGVDYRMDGTISTHDSLYGVFHWSKGSPWELGSTSYPTTYGNNPDYGYTDYSISGTETHIFSPTALNDFRVALVVHSSVRTGQNTNFAPWSLFPQLPVSDNGGLPTMAITGYTGMFYDYGKGYPFPEYDVEFIDNFTKIVGRHTLKFGFDETGYKNSIKQGGPSLTTTLGNPLGTFNFSGHWTGNKGWTNGGSSQGNAFADFLLGTADSSNYAGVITNIVTYNRDWEFYAQDTFQVVPRLTLNLGLRYQYQTPWTVRDNRVSYMDLANNKLAIPEDGSTVTTPAYAVPSLMTAYPYETTAAAGWPKSYYIKDTNNFGPRLGFAYRLLSNDRAVLRGGWGMFYNTLPGFIGQHENIFNPPYRTGATFTSKLPGTLTAPYLPDVTFSNPFPAASQSGPTTNPTIYMTARNLQNPTNYQWNLTYEEQFLQNWAGRISWVGLHSPNALYYAGDINRPGVQTKNVTTQAQRPYQPWGSINETHTDGRINFSQLQLELNHQYSHGFLMQVEYSFTKSKDNVPVSGGVQNVQDYNADYGHTDGTPKQNLTMNYLYDLPFGAKRRYQLHNKFVDELVGGWSMSAITIYRSGVPFTVNFSVPSNVVGWWGGRADRVPGVNPYARQGGHNVTSGVQWFNPAAFAPPQPWAWGNSQRNSLFGPGFWNWDVSALKSFSLTERQTLQFRCDALNVANHFNLTTVNNTIADTRDGGVAAPLAGKVTSGSGSRTIQFGLKYSF